MSQYLPFVMQQLFDRPHALAVPQADMIVAALSGRMDIRSLETMCGTVDQRGLIDLAAMGRVEADQREMKDNERPSQAVARREANSMGVPYDLTSSGIAIIPVKGVLKRSWGVGPYSGATGYDGIFQQIMHAEDNDDVRAMWFDINSGGGTTDGLFDLSDAIYSNSARHGGKKKVAMCADYAASAAYCIAAACDEVYTPELGIVGSIGCVMMHAEYTGALEKEGINVTIIRSRSGKARGGPSEVLDAQTLKEFQEMCDEADAVFARQVGIYRPSVTEKVVSDLDGRVYTGGRALATGLIDRVMSEPAAWAELERSIARS